MYIQFTNIASLETSLDDRSRFLTFALSHAVMCHVTCEAGPLRLHRKGLAIILCFDKGLVIEFCKMTPRSQCVPAAPANKLEQFCLPKLRSVGQSRPRRINIRAGSIALLLSSFELFHRRRREHGATATSSVGMAAETEEEEAAKSSEAVVAVSPPNEFDPGIGGQTTAKSHVRGCFP